MSEITPDFSNCPTCPEMKKKIDKIFNALLGEDGMGLQSGIVYEIKRLKEKESINASWSGFAKPILIAVVSSALTFLITYGLTHLA